MKILWLFVLLQTALSQSGFGISYLRNSRLCHQWTCINGKLGLSDSLPTSEEFGIVLRGLLPPGAWHDVVDNVLYTCYQDRPRRYSNTCPVQAIMHCAVDQLIANCPEANIRKEDACAPVNSIAGFQNMFTQSRYENIEGNMAVERRPAWFLKNYFNTKCCNLPPLFNSTTMSECGFTSMMQYYLHNPQDQSKRVLPSQRRDFPTTTPVYNGDSLQIVTFTNEQPANNQSSIDPLDCCDLSDFIQTSWRQECNFELSWQDQNRLVIKSEAPASTTAPSVTTSTSSPVTRRDVVIVPESCEKTTCVFNKLNILSNGTVDTDAFIRLLDKLTTSQPKWNSAKGRVVTTCLRKPVTEYTATCEINRILACTFDVLTENCPDAKKSDPCKHMSKRTERECQISSSRYRPKNRREICSLPSLVDAQILTECGLTSLDKKESMTTVIKPKTYRPFSSQSRCLDLTPSTSCVMRKMGVLNKYQFMDYFKIKERIQHFSAHNDWKMEIMYLNAFSYGPLYRDHCNSAKKLLNILDSMLMTCPESKKKNTPQCANIFNLIANTPVNTRNASQEYANQIMKHFHHVFFPSALTPKAVRQSHRIKFTKKPIYSYGILNDKYAPKVTTIDVKPKDVKPIEKPPLVLLPVYMRVPNSNLMIRRPFLEDGVMRGGFPLNNRIAQAYMSTPSVVTSRPVFATSKFYFAKPVSTYQLFSTTPVSTSRPISTTRDISTKNYLSKFEMIKPE